MLLQEKGGNDRSIHCSPLHLLDGSWMPQRRIADGSDFLLQRFFVQLLSSLKFCRLSRKKYSNREIFQSFSNILNELKKLFKIFYFI